MTHKFELLVQLLRTDFSKAVFALCHMPMGVGLRQEIIPHLGHSDTQVTDLMHLMYLLCDCDDTVDWQVVRRCRSHRLPLVRSVAYETSFRANPELEIECLRLYPIGPNQLKALARDIEVPTSQRERAMALLMLFHGSHCTLEELQQWSSRPLPHAQGTGFEVSSFSNLLLLRRIPFPDGTGKVDGQIMSRPGASEMIETIHGSFRPGWHLANNVLRAFRE